VTKLDGNIASDIPYGKKPSDQDDSWNEFAARDFKMDTKVPTHIQIDVYQAQNGWGWILVFDIWKQGLGPDNYGTDGNHWKFQHNEGPEVREGIWDEWFIEPEI
jgi:hypothetical protein